MREATAADADAVVALLEEVGAEGRWIATEPPFDSVKRRDEWLANLGTRTTAFVAECEGELAGELSLWDGEPGALVLGMAVRKAWRRRGIGTSLMRAALAAARTRAGVRRLELAVFPHNAPALWLYRSFGFVEIELKQNAVPRRNGETWDALVMRLELS